MSATTATGHAVVVGAGIAGLAAARALRETYARVTLLERDQLDLRSPPRPRPGVPQGSQVHLLLAAGVQAIEELFPGAVAALAADGAEVVPPARARLCFGGNRLARSRSDHAVVLASRPRLEASVRRWLAHDPRVELRDGTVARGLRTCADRRRVTGVEVAAAPADTEAETLTADLVVDATGRRGPTGRWLRDLEVDQPPVDELPIEVRYATCRYRLPSDALDGDRFVAIGPTADRPVGGVASAIEDDRWLVTLYGLAGTPAPRTTDEAVAFARDLPFPDVAEVLDVGTPDGDPAPYRFPANRWQRFDRVRGLPRGLLITGDAVCSFNPIYGQGMTIGLLEALRLRSLVARDPVPTHRGWARAIRPLVADTWQVTTGADLAVDAVAGRRPLPVRASNRYVARLQARATDDPALTDVFLRVTGLLDRPHRLLHPATAVRVLGP